MKLAAIICIGIVLLFLCLYILCWLVDVFLWGDEEDDEDDFGKPDDWYK